MTKLKLTPLRTEIVKFIGDREVRKSELVEKFKHRYDSKPDHNLGLVLKPMVEQRILHRPKKGFYCRGNRRVEFHND